MSKFCLIASFPSSVLRFRGELLKALQSCGLGVHVILPCIENEQDKEVRQTLLDRGYTVHEIAMQRTGLNPMRDVQTVWAIFKVLKKIKPDYVLAYTIKPVIYGMVAARWARVPRRFALITGLGYAFYGVKDNHSPVSKVQRMIFAMYRFALRGVSKVIFQNPDDLALFRALSLMPDAMKTAIVNGSGVDTQFYAPAPLPVDPAHQVIPHFLCIARLLEDKGIREYAQAALHIKKAYPDAQFSLVGWIDSNPKAIRQQELDAWVADGRLSYLGKLSDVRPAIQASSVFVLPSYREGTPRTVLEAMAMGRAIITTDAPGCRETVVDGENGFLVPPQSVEALSHAMETLITTPHLIERMGVASREMAVSKFDVHSVNKAMLIEMGVQ